MSDPGSSYPRAVAVPLDVAVREGDDGEWLAWRVRAPGNVDYGFARGERPEGCLTEFLALEEAPLEDFPAFVRRCGVLGICAEHGLPGMHDACTPRSGENAQELFPRRSLTEGWTVPLRTYQEPVAAWRAMAGELAAVLRLARALRAGEPGEHSDLARLFGEETAGVSTGKRAVGERRGRLGALVNGWLDVVGVQPVFAWPFAAESPELTLDKAHGEAGEFAWPARSLYPVLLTQLAGELARP